MSLANKETQKLSPQELREVLKTARGDGEIDLLIKNVKILDLVNGEVVESSIAISGKTIAGIGKEYDDQPAKRIYDAGGATAVPGFIDGHLHVESSMMHPFEFERLTLPLGTTTAICDPHEITNVMGDRGFSWFLRCSELMDQNLFVQVSSCIPALPGFETNGGQFDIIDMKKYKEHPRVLGLAEMMNFPGVINGVEGVLEKVEEFAELNLDGHSPMLRGKQLNAYIAAGIQNCHETIFADEAKEKLQKGMGLIIREGSVAKNLKTLAPVVNEFNSCQCLLCTDDRNPYEIFNEGHINYMIKKMINELGTPAHIAYRLSSFSAAKHFGLKKLGLIAPGKQADIVLVGKLEDVDVKEVFKKGKLVSELDLPAKVNEKLEKSQPPKENTIKRNFLAPTDFNYDLTPGTYNVMEIVKDEIITNHLKVKFDGEEFEQDDISFITVIERYGQNRKPSLGLVKGMGLTRGAIASSVAHDSHNIVVIGKTPQDIATAANEVIENAGGFCVVDKGRVTASLSLPIAGLLSLESAETINEGIIRLKAACKEIEVAVSEPFIQMAFLALPVIPTLKITDMGLVDVTKFEFIDLKCEEA
ncbi:adenine deaminase [Halobacteriovorax sp. XZX-3]|uniref:adenine deaminase n=1 Tax=unclassified Halobacteriovorax TaxID=2639665 RepID=UPI003715560E